MKAINLKTEYLINPIGIDIQNPRLMWTCEGDKRQSAYRIIAVTDGKPVWDSGKVLSDEMYADYLPKLVSRQRVEWAVTVWNEHDVSSRIRTRWPCFLLPMGEMKMFRNLCSG